MVGPTPKHDRSGNARAFHKFLSIAGCCIRILSCRFWGRSAPYQSGGAFGFRDQLQDHGAYSTRAGSWLAAHPARGARQFVDGDVQHWWHPDTGAGVRTASVTIFYGFPSSSRITFAPPATPRSSIRWFHSSTGKPLEEQRERESFHSGRVHHARILCSNIAGGPSRALQLPVRMDCL